MLGSPLALVGELALLQKLVGRGGLDVSCLARVLVDVRVQIVVVHVFGVVLSVAGVLFNVETTVGHVVPAGFALVGEQNVGSVLPSEPPPHTLREHPCAFRVGSLMQPVVERRLPSIAPGSDLTWELALKSGNHIIEGQCVGRKMHPSGVSSEDGKCLSWPQTVVFVPASNVRLTKKHVVMESLNIHFPLDGAASVLEILLKNAGPLLAGDVLAYEFGSALEVSLGDVEASAEFDVALELLVGLVVAVVQGASFEVDHSGTSVHVVDGGGQSDLGSETVTSHRGHGELVLVHETGNVVGDVLQKSERY